MKKTYTITCHQVYNYGASLQAYALQKFLLGKGFENKIIDYMPNYLAWHYHFSWWISSRGSHYKYIKNNVILRFLYVLIRYIRDLKSLKRRDAFDRFRDENLLLTETCKCVNEISDKVAGADALIAGSDQIWNSYSLENGHDSAFYLAFGSQNVKRISYAASFGVNEIKEKDVNFVKEQLARFDYISIREEKGQRLLSNLGFDSNVVVDPVFLLEKEEWEKLPINKNINNSYILLYSIGSMPEQMMEMARALEKKTGYQLICIRSNKHVPNVKEIKDAGPNDFVGLIKNATYVLSNSFHATAFSLIFEKEFYSYPYGANKTSERIVNLLDYVDLADRYNAIIPDLSNKIDHKKVKTALGNISAFSIEWLNNALR